MDAISFMLLLQVDRRAAQHSPYQGCMRMLFFLHFVLWLALPGAAAAAGKGVLDQVDKAFFVSNAQQGILTRSSETVQFYGVRGDGRQMMQKDYTDVLGMYQFNPNARGLHDFYLNVTHRRRQEFPRDGGQNLTLTEKSEFQIRFIHGELTMRIFETSAKILTRVPRGWFKIEGFKLGKPITPDVSYLLIIDPGYIFKQSVLLDTALTQPEFVSSIKGIPQGDLTEVPGVECYALQYVDPQFLLRTSLAVSVRDFAGLPMTDEFKQEVASDASIYFTVCLDPKTNLIVSYKSTRGRVNATTRVQAWNATITWSAQKNMSFEYVDEPLLFLTSKSGTKSTPCIFLALIVVLWLLGH